MTPISSIISAALGGWNDVMTLLYVMTLLLLCGVFHRLDWTTLPFGGRDDVHVCTVAKAFLGV